MESSSRAKILKRPRQAALVPFCQRKYFKKTAKGKVLKGASPAAPCARGARPRATLTDALPRLPVPPLPRPRPSVIKERYLRDDIACGSAYCSACAGLDGQKRVLSAAGFGGSALLPQGHYIVPDTNAFLHQVGPSLGAVDGWC